MSPSSPRTPPRYVPTLTEVVGAAADGAPESATPVEAAPPAALAVAPETAVPAPAASLEDGIVHRVMQRVDVSLEPRLRAAIGALVTEQSQNLERRLRLEIESVVRECVADALASELPSQH